MKGRLKNLQQGFSDGLFDVESRTGSIPCPLQLQKRPIVILHRSIIGNGLPGFGQIIAGQTAAFLTEFTVGLNLITACLQTALDIQHLLFCAGIFTLSARLTEGRQRPSNRGFSNGPIHSSAFVHSVCVTFTAKQPSLHILWTQYHPHAPDCRQSDCTTETAECLMPSFIIH